jgi:hypothetical protein
MTIRPKSTIDDYYDDDDTNDNDDLNKEAHQKLQAPPDWDGPIHQRHCTDSACLALLLVALIVFSWIGLYAIQRGDARVIVYPMDYDGNICGLHFGGVDMTNYPFLYYVNSYTGGVCVEECPSLRGLVEDDLTDMRTLITYNGIWQTEDGLAELGDNATDLIRVADYSQSEDVQVCTTEDCFPDNDLEASWTSDGIARGLGFAYYVGDTYDLFQRCYLTTDAEVRIAELTGSATEEAFDFINPLETHAFWTNLYGDLWTARYLIAGFGFGGSLLLSLIYVGLLRIPFLLTTIIWFSITCVVGVFAVAGYYAYDLAEQWSLEDPLTSVRPEQIKYTEITSYVLFGLSGLFFLLACCFRNAIQTAVGCVREAGRAINRMVLLFGIPCLQAVTMLGFWIVWGYFSVHLASLGEVTTRSFPVDLQGTEVTLRAFEFDDFVTYCGWYMLFIFFWMAAFVLAIGDMAVALAVSRWYFTVEKRRVNSYWVMGALGTTLRYHLGTLAFGSLLIAIVRILRAILMKIQRTVASMTNPKVANVLLCCCQCCLCCVERILKFINKNAYIQCAIFGTSFMESGRQSFFLILRNAGRIGAVSFVSNTILFTGKLLISILTTIAAYYTVVEHEDYVLKDNESLYSYGGPVLMIFCISYFMASMFMSVFDTGILTILHCFVADEEMFDEASRYTDKNFRLWVDQQQQKNQK